jgi:hypothetical protein
VATGQLTTSSPTFNRNRNRNRATLYQAQVTAPSITVIVTITSTISFTILCHPPTSIIYRPFVVCRVVLLTAQAPSLASKYITDIRYET